MYDLDNIKTLDRTRYDISDIPLHIVNLFQRYNEVPYSQWSDCTTSAQKRTRTMRFNRFCKACEEAGVNVPSALFRLTNELFAQEYE